jgi:hypothetical protein
MAQLSVEKSGGVVALSSNQTPVGQFSRAMPWEEGQFRSHPPIIISLAKFGNSGGIASNYAHQCVADGPPYWMG